MGGNAIFIVLFFMIALRQLIGQFCQAVGLHSSFRGRTHWISCRFTCTLLVLFWCEKIENACHWRQITAGILFIASAAHLEAILLLRPVLLLSRGKIPNPGWPEITISHVISICALLGRCLTHHHTLPGTGDENLKTIPGQSKQFPGRSHVLLSKIGIWTSRFQISC